MVKIFDNKIGYNDYLQLLLKLRMQYILLKCINDDTYKFNKQYFDLNLISLLLFEYERVAGCVLVICFSVDKSSFTIECLPDKINIFKKN